MDNEEASWSGVSLYDGFMALNQAHPASGSDAEALQS